MESEDSFGRAIWGLGVLISAEEVPEHLRKKATSILKKSLKWLDELESLRAISFSIIGLNHVAKVKNNLDIEKEIKKLSDKLVRRFNKQKEKDNNWEWFEDCLTYSNYKLSEALFRAYDVLKVKDYKIVAEKSLIFLNKVAFEKKNFFAPIGQDGWYFRNGKRAYFDQQPEDTASAVESLSVAYKITRKKAYLNKANLAFQWFLGKNHLNQMVYDEATGGCYDGLGKYSLNFNQGAESSLSYFLARLAIEKIN